MSTPAAPPLPNISSSAETDQDDKRPLLFVSLRNHALVGAAASSLLALIELTDLSVQLTPVFQSFLERAIFCVYFSLNVAGGLVIGVFVGLFAYAASLLKRTAQRVMARGNPVKLIHKLIAGAGLSALFAFVLNQQPQVHAYIVEIIREAEKIESLTEPLLNHERAASYLILIVLVIACSIVWMATLALSRSRPQMRALWVLSLVALIACAYYVDSRFETQQYGTSIHRSMFLLSTALSMSLIGSMFGSLFGSLFGSTPGSIVFHPPSLPFWPALGSPIRTAALIVVPILLIASVAFTFAHFDKNQNLKTQISYRTSQAKQYFKLAQWALDFDRDGYSSYLGGGDCDDRRADINPRQVEVVGDGVDHNCIGGELTQQDIADWNLEHSSLHKPPEASARRLNVIYVFIDALRADHLGAYGYNRKTSPNLDKLAARSSLFENAYTPAPNTFEALPKFTQGTYWDAHVETWPEIMARNGYDALLFPRRISTLLRHVRGMSVVESARVGTFEGTIDAAIKVLVDTPPDRPFCAYLYSTDTHRPYKPHEDFYYGPSIADLYDGEIAYLDFHLGRLFDSMEKAGRLDDTIVVIMADHGESLGERGVYKHSSQLYDEQARVPMIIHLPGLPARLITDYVSTIDLGPTILNAVGLDYPKECAGVSLAPLMRGEPFTHPPVYGEQTTQEVSPFVRPEQQLDPGQKKYMIITQDGFKLIYNRDAYNFELFNLKTDPAELRNLFDQMPERAAEMKKLLGRFIDVVTVSRPRDADESQYFFGPTGEVREAK
ncbi:MAG: sulfatase-like hydrolase/transferase [Acidobacteriota bacterium]